MVSQLTPAEVQLRRRRVRATTIRLVLFAVAVYIAFIIAFMNRQ
jgi:fumarate reductase subunit C